MLLIDAVDEVTRERAVSFLRPEHQKRIEAVYAKFEDEKGFAKLATPAEIAAQDWSLSIPLYVKGTVASTGTAAGGKKQTLSQSWTTWEASGRKFWSEMDSVVDMLDGLVDDDKLEAAHG